MTFILGLTGSIGMGKSTTAQMFRDLGIPVWDADAAVHRLYAQDGAAVDQVHQLVPGSKRHGAIDRSVLKTAIAADPDLLLRLESIVHPLVAADRKTFIETHGDSPILVLDIPLLFETGGDQNVDATLVVSTDAATQRVRVLDRPGMTEEGYADILKRQMPDAEKRARATYVIPTSSLAAARQAVEDLVTRLKRAADA
ncbi:MAG: dephospho-CoA kinase [Octadecabacter sp.]|nr:dephospho-CoA kinase [Octadecabacter sp.]